MPDELQDAWLGVPFLISDIVPQLVSLANPAPMWSPSHQSLLSLLPCLFRDLSGHIADRRSWLWSFLALIVSHFVGPHLRSFAKGLLRPDS
jgi:hypothetical protein